MHADIQVIDHFGVAGFGHGGELDAIAATVSSLPVAAAAPVFGPVGAVFLTALAAAAADQAAAVTALSRRVDAGAAAAHATTRAYTATEVQNRHRLTMPVAGLEG